MFSTDRSRGTRSRNFTAAVLTALIGAGMLWSTGGPGGDGQGPRRLGHLPPPGSPA